uniref:Uncharacterized protein n=1 Tax=Glossina austeni TaxID=7395 RepID=A0A1A9VBK0_GLOAU
MAIESSYSLKNVKRGQAEVRCGTITGKAVQAQLQSSMITKQEIKYHYEPKKVEHSNNSNLFHFPCDCNNNNKADIFHVIATRNVQCPVKFFTFYINIYAIYAMKHRPVNYRRLIMDPYPISELIAIYVHDPLRLLTTDIYTDIIKVLRSSCLLNLMNWYDNKCTPKSTAITLNGRGLKAVRQPGFVRSTQAFLNCPNTNLKNTCPLCPLLYLWLDCNEGVTSSNSIAIDNFVTSPNNGLQVVKVVQDMSIALKAL